MADRSVKHYQVQAGENLRSLIKEIKNYDPLFRGSANLKDFFMLAVQFGYCKGTRLPLRGDGVDGLTRPHDFSEEETAILRAIAFEATGDLSIVKDLIAVFKIAEEFANGGAAPLKDFFFDDPADFTKKFSKMLKDFKPAK